MGTFQGCLWGPRGVAEGGYISRVLVGSKGVAEGGYISRVLVGSKGGG